MNKIKDLGPQYATSKSNRRNNYSIYECPLCNKHFRCADYHIKSGNQKSCGCMVKNIDYKKIALKNTKYTKKEELDLYPTWNSMKTRCYNIKSKAFKNYGARGIYVCDKWKNSYSVFRKWCIENGYRKYLELDRIDNDGNYEPSNCKFSTRSQNSQNTRLLQINNTTGYRCVYKHSRCKTYFIIIQNDGKIHYFCKFKTAKDAAIFYNNWVITNNTLHPLNIIP